jgi:hypothetical protein
MGIVNPKSLAATLDAINGAFFLGQKLSSSEKTKAAKWIAGRQGEPGSYRRMFAPTKPDFTKGIRVFTGEPIRTGAATAHILGEEACRALILLGAADSGVRSALKRASEGMMAAIKEVEAYGYTPGMYCCGICSVALWRHLAVGGLRDQERLLRAGMKTLKGYRLGNGQWRRFPFYYTLLALDEIALPAAAGEMRYAAPVLEKALKRPPRNDRFDARRRVLTERILARC